MSTDVFEFQSLGCLLPSPMLIRLSPSILEFQRICAIYVFKIDFLIFSFFLHLYPAVCYSVQPSASESQWTM